MSKEERLELEKMEKEISISRWKPDTHTRSIYGKPIFHAYGKGNTNPTVGGVVYGQYMLTHNIHPESGDNVPQYHQVYDSAHNKTFENGKPILEPTRELPRTPRMTKTELKELKGRNPIMPFKPASHLKRDVQQLNLLKEVCFASKHSTPAPSEFVTEEDEEKSKSKRRKSVEKMVPKEETKIQSKTVTKRGQSAKPKTIMQSKVVQNQVNDQQVALAEIQNLAKGSNFKPNNTNKETAFMNTMASTGNIKFENINNQKSTKGVTRNADISPMPQYSAAQSKKQEKEIELDESRYDVENYKYEINDQVNESVDHSENNQTAYPVGFPFCLCPNSDHRVDVHEKDPRSYQFVPQCWTRRIPAAGRTTFKGEPVYSIIIPKNN